MATRQVKTVTKTAPAARSNPIGKTAAKPKAAPTVVKLVTTKAAYKERTTTSAPKPASMTGPLPPIVTLKHLAEWAGYNHGVAKKQVIEMFTGFVADIRSRAQEKSAFPTLGSCKYEFDPHARRAKGVTRPQARRSGSKPVKRQRRLHSESQRV